MKKKFLSIILVLSLVLILLPVTALAAEASVQYLDITEDPPGCSYANTESGAEGVLISGGTYTLAGTFDGAIVVNDAAVTYNANIDLSSVGNEIFVFGSASLIANNVTVTAGSYTSFYEGADGDSLLSFIGRIPKGTFYSYTVTADTELDDFLTAYDLTIQSGNTLRINAPSGADAPDHYRLTVTHALNVSGTLTAAHGSSLEFLDGAALPTGLDLYKDVDGNGTFVKLEDDFDWTEDENESRGFIFDTAAGFDPTPENSSNGDEVQGLWLLYTSPQGGEDPGDPQRDPTYRVRWDWNALDVMRGEEIFENQYESQELSYPEPNGGNGLVFTFTAKESQADQPRNEFFGLKVTEDGNTPTVTYIKAADLSGNATDGYTYTIPEASFVNNIEIEAISWAAPFDNEFIVFYDNPDGTAGVSYTGGTVTDPTALNEANVAEFTPNTAYTFTLTPPTSVTTPYKVQIEPNGGETEEQAVTSNIFTYTPADSSGFKVRIYWTEEQYAFDNCQAGQGEFQIEYAWNGNGTVTHTGGTSSASYNGCTRVNLTNGTQSLVLTLTPTPGGDPANEVNEVRLEGQTVEVSEYLGGTYTLALNDGFKRVEVSFTSSDGGDDSGGETYIITTSVVNGADGLPHGTIEPTSANVEEHRNFNVAITPDYGWMISSVVIDGGEGSGGSELNAEEIEAVTRDGFYTFNDVTANHTIAVTFVEDEDSGEFTDFAALKTYIESYIWAYWTDNISTITAAESMMVDRLWDVASYEYAGAFVNNAAVETALTVSGGNSSEVFAGQTLEYFTYSVMLKDEDGTEEDIVATGKIYKLAQKQDFILSATKGGNTSYTIQSLNLREGEYAGDISPCIDTSFVVDYDTVTDENDESREVPKVAFYGIRIEGGTGHTDYSDSFHVSGANYIGCQIILYKPEFAGVLANPSGETKRAAAWDFGNYPFVCLNGTTENDPFVLTTYFGYSNITLSVPNDIALHSITNITTTLPEGAVTIDQNTKTITFNSNFYDTVPLVITYNEGELGYLIIKRVGIDIQAYGRHGDELGRDTLHGTQNGVYITWEDDDYAIYATYYYPSSDNSPVDLYTTYTWADGRVETRLLTYSPQLYTPADGILTPSDDFIVYKGLAADCPVSVSVIAVKTGGDDTTFAGAKLGSGAGVTWEYAVGIAN